MITLIRSFIEAQIIVDWEIRLATVRKMFHFPMQVYTSATPMLAIFTCRTWLPWMRRCCLRGTRKSEGFSFFRRPDNFWSSMCSNMSIEESLMKFMKSRVGLTHGRQVSEKVVTWECCHTKKMSRNWTVLQCAFHNFRAARKGANLKNKSL